MKKTITLISIIIMMIVSTSTNSLSAQNKKSVQDTTVTEQTSSLEDSKLTDSETSEGINWEKVLILVIQIIILLAILSLIAHMVYNRYFKKYLALFEDSYFKEIRNTTTGLPSENVANSLIIDIKEAIALFSTIDNTYYEDGSELKCITKNSEIKKAIATYKKVVSAAPTDKDVINELNTLADLINENNVRQVFHGSKALLWVTGIIGLLLGIIVAFAMEEIWWTGLCVMAFFGINAYLYYISCQGPAWLMAKRIRKNSGHASNTLIASVFGMMASAKTVRTTTKWSDGTKTVDDDNSQHYIAWILGAIVFVFVAVYLFIFTLWNYARNYVFYF